jgi:hypothetical protein
MIETEKASGAGNQQERLSMESIPPALGNFLSGFALGEGSFMVVCRRRTDYKRHWKLSAAFNVSQQDDEPLYLFQRTLQCGSLRKAGNNGWYYEVNNLVDLTTKVVPFFDHFPLVGTKHQEFLRFKEVVNILSQSMTNDIDYLKVLSLREQMNRGGKRKYSKERILRDYTPNLSVIS